MSQEEIRQEAFPVQDYLRPLESDEPIPELTADQAEAFLAASQEIGLQPGRGMTAIEPRSMSVRALIGDMATADKLNLAGSEVAGPYITPGNDGQLRVFPGIRIYRVAEQPPSPEAA